MTSLITFLRNLITAPELPALILFIAAGLCAGLALIAVGRGDMGRANYSLAFALLFVLAAYVYKDIRK